MRARVLLAGHARLEAPVTVRTHVRPLLRERGQGVKRGVTWRHTAELKLAEARS